MKRFTSEEIHQQLVELGVARGGLVMVHASMRAIGPVEGGADGLLDAILETLGDEGTLLMVLGADPDEPFEAATTPVDVEDMGVLAEVFRNRAATAVNDHAAARYAALGPADHELIDDPPLHDYHGPDSPLHRLVERGGQVLRLGAPGDTVTLTHWAEYLAQVPNKRRVKRRYVRADIGEQWIESLDDNDGIVDWPHGDYFASLLRDFLAGPHALAGRVGNAAAELIDGRGFVQFAVAWMERNLRSPTLPKPETEAEFDALDRTDAVFARALRHGFAEHVGERPIEPTAVGSYPVFYVADTHVAKLFAPIHHDSFQTERAALQFLETETDVPAPRLVATAEIDGWHALLITRVEGRSLKESWSSLSREQHKKVCRSLGEVIRKLHAVQPPLLSNAPVWDRFVGEQIRDCAQVQTRRGLDAVWAEQIPGFLESVDLSADLSLDLSADISADISMASNAGPRVLLHTEIMLEHVFVTGDESQLEISGLIDFEPAMIGPPEYELASFGLFVAQGDAELFSAFLDGYGKARDPQLHRRVMAYTLLHRYSRLSWYLQFMPQGESLEALARRWFSDA